MCYEERLRTLELPTLAYRRLRADVIETYKVVHKLYDPLVALDIGLDTRSAYELRGNKYRLIKTRSNTSTRKNMFVNRVVNSWNSLPPEVVEAPTLNSFKKRLDRHWGAQDIVYNYTDTLDLHAWPGRRDGCALK